MHPTITMATRLRRAQRMRWICKAQERRESVATYFPMGGRRTLKVIAVVGSCFCCEDVAVNDWQQIT